MPPLGRGIGTGDEEAAGVIVDVAELRGKPVRRAEQLAVHVYLLLPGAVADTHRRLARQPSRCGRIRSLRSCSPPTPNMICRLRSRPTVAAAALVMNEKKSCASSGQAATRSASR